MPDAFDVAIEALLEISRPDLANCLFGQAGVVHFDQPSVIAQFTVRRKYDRIDFNHTLWEWPIKSIADLALIEKAMRIGLSAANKEYTCAECEKIFEVYGLSHALTQDITKDHRLVVRAT